MTAPTDEQALAALKRVQALTPEEFERALNEDVGHAMVSLFNALARAMHPQDDDDAIAKKLHLMMLAWLMARDR
jgi:hypothetical protein